MSGDKLKTCTRAGGANDSHVGLQKHAEGSVNVSTRSSKPPAPHDEDELVPCRLLIVAVRNASVTERSPVV